MDVTLLALMLEGSTDNKEVLFIEVYSKVPNIC